MSRSQVMEKVEKPFLKADIPTFHVGDTVRVHTRIIEGSKERIQVFEGTVIARKGSGVSETFSLHRVAYGEGMERVFLLHSPRIAKIEVIREGDVRRAKLYYLRGTFGKKSRVKARVTARGKKKEATVVAVKEAAPVEEVAAVEAAPAEPASAEEAAEAKAPAPVEEAAAEESSQEDKA